MDVTYLEALLISITHIGAIIYVLKYRRDDKPSIDLENIYSVAIEYLLTGSVLKAMLRIRGNIDKESLIGEDTTLYSDRYISLENIEEREISLDHLETELSKYITFLDEYLNSIELKSIFIVSSIIFPPILLILISFISPTILLSITPIIQLALYQIVNRWIR